MGSDVYEHIVLNGKLQADNGLHWRNTIFGWVVTGKILEQTNQIHTVTVLKTDIDLKRSSSKPASNDLNASSYYPFIDSISCLSLTHSIATADSDSHT